MASPHTAALTGNISIKTEDGSCSNRAVRSLQLALGLNEGSAAPDDYVYAPSSVVSAPATWQALPMPVNAVTLLSVYIRAANRRDTYTLRITRTTAGQQVLGPQRGTVLLEFDPDDPATLVEVQGDLTIEYLGMADT